MLLIKRRKRRAARSASAHRTSKFACFAASSRGATALEFALLAIPFLAVTFAIIEFAVIFLVLLTLESATAQAARQIRVATAATVNGISTTSGGTVTYNTASVDAFRQAVCANMGWLSTSCTAGLSDSSTAVSDGLVVDVRNPSSFSSGATTSAATTNGALDQFTPTKCFYSGQAGGDIVVLRVFYPWQLITPFLNAAFPKLSNGMIVLSATEVFKLEPNTSTDGSGSKC